MTAPTPAELADAERQGRDAHAAGARSADCPHDAFSPLGLRWLRGYTIARDTDRYGPIR